eukprot:gene25414-15905_t
MDMGTDNDRPTLNATLNQTACWTSHSPGCSYNPWGEIAVKTNGGVPQAANLSLHSAALKAGLDNQMPDKESSGFLVIDWEAWRPDSKECDDGLSSYLEYSRRLVLADATWPHASNATATRAEAARRFDEGAQRFFTATINTVRKLRPNVKLGFYSQGIDQPDVHSHSNPVNSDLIWLWSQVDFLCPSIYPSANATRDAASIEAMIAGAIESSNLVNPPAKRPAVFPYARAFVAPPGEQPFSKQVLAEQVQLPAGMGVDGIILWGSSSDYHGNGCAMIEQELTAFAGPVVAQCSADRAACARTRCSGNGRCVDYNPATLESTCIGSGSALASSSATCRCNPGFAGNSCENSAVLIN